MGPDVAPTVASSDGVAVVMHHLAGRHSGPPLIVAHATGFHGRCYTPMAAALGDHHDVWAPDLRGHGATLAPPDWNPDWNRYGDDVEAAAAWLGRRDDAEPPPAPGSLIGFGHSMGGATLLMAAHRRPSLFRALVLFEPIVPPPPDRPIEPEASPLVVGARRRRRQFDSFDTAIANFASKPPMSSFDPAALESYVRGGFVLVDPHDRHGPVRLRCEPELEAQTFAAGFHHHTWDLLPPIDVPTLVIAGGADADSGPAQFAEPIALRLGAGRFLSEPHLDHFGPFTDPPVVAEAILTMLRSL